MRKFKNWFDWRVAISLLVVFMVGQWLPFATSLGLVLVGVCIGRLCSEE